MSRNVSRRSFIASLAGAIASVVAACSGPEGARPNGTRFTTPRVSGTPATDDASRSTASPVTTAAQSNTSVPASTAATATSAPLPTQSGPQAAASPAPSATPTARRRVSVAVDPAIPSSFMPRAVRIRDALADSLGGTAVDGDADYVVMLASDATASQSRPVLSVDYVAVVSRRLLVRNLEFGALGDLWNGTTNDWMNAGSPVSHGVARITVEGSAGPLDPTRADRDVSSIDELAELLESERGGIAIVPLADIDFRVRTLNIDSVNPIRPDDQFNALRVDFEIRTRAGVDTTAMRSMVTSLSGLSGPQPVSMTWAGDIIMGRLVHVKMVSYGDWAAPFRSIHPEISWADVTISNLECAISDSYETPTSPTTFDFKTDPPAVAGLELAQIDILSRANNHSYNFGAIGMRDTTDILDRAGILHFGMGESIHESRQATVIERGGTKYAFLGYNGISDAWDGATESSPGTNPMLDWLVVEDVRREVERGHVVIPFFHWGTEYVYDPTEQQRYFAHVAIQSGAAMVMGSHPHWVQAVETYLGKPIIYSLGNFVFDQEWSLETKQGMIAHVWMRGEKPLSIDLVPVLIEDYHKPRRMANWEAWPVLEEVWAASDRITSL